MQLVAVMRQRQPIAMFNNGLFIIYILIEKLPFQPIQAKNMPGRARAIRAGKWGNPAPISWIKANRKGSGRVLLPGKSVNLFYE